MPARGPDRAAVLQLGVDPFQASADLLGLPQHGRNVSQSAEHDHLLFTACHMLRKMSLEPLAAATPSN
jgi:hypothetical protein